MSVNFKKKAYYCSKCNKEFRRMNQLEKHELIHSNVLGSPKPYKGKIKFVRKINNIRRDLTALATGANGGNSNDNNSFISNVNNVYDNSLYFMNERTSKQNNGKKTIFIELQRRVLLSNNKLQILIESISKFYDVGSSFMDLVLPYTNIDKFSKDIVLVLVLFGSLLLSDQSFEEIWKEVLNMVGRKNFLEVLIDVGNDDLLYESKQSFLALSLWVYLLNCTAFRHNISVGNIADELYELYFQRLRDIAISLSATNSMGKLFKPSENALLLHSFASFVRHSNILSLENNKWNDGTVHSIYEYFLNTGVNKNDAPQKTIFQLLKDVSQGDPATLNFGGDDNYMLNIISNCLYFEHLLDFPNFNDKNRFHKTLLLVISIQQDLLINSHDNIVPNEIPVNYTFSAFNQYFMESKLSKYFSNKDIKLISDTYWLLLEIAWVEFTNGIFEKFDNQKLLSRFPSLENDDFIPGLMSPNALDELEILGELKIEKLNDLLLIPNVVILALLTGPEENSFSERQLFLLIDILNFMVNMFRIEIKKVTDGKPLERSLMNPIIKQIYLIWNYILQGAMKSTSNESNYENFLVFQKLITSFLIPQNKPNDNTVFSNAFALEYHYFLLASMKYLKFNILMDRLISSKMFISPEFKNSLISIWETLQQSITDNWNPPASNNQQNISYQINEPSAVNNGNYSGSNPKDIQNSKIDKIILPPPIMMSNVSSVNQKSGPYTSTNQPLNMLMNNSIPSTNSPINMNQTGTENFFTPMYWDISNKFPRRTSSSRFTFDSNNQPINTSMGKINSTGSSYSNAVPSSVTSVDSQNFESSLLNPPNRYDTQRGSVSSLISQNSGNFHAIPMSLSNEMHTQVKQSSGTSPSNNYPGIASTLNYYNPPVPMTKSLTPNIYPGNIPLGRNIDIESSKRVPSESRFLRRPNNENN